MQPLHRVGVGGLSHLPTAWSVLRYPAPCACPCQCTWQCLQQTLQDSYEWLSTEYLQWSVCQQACWWSWVQVLVMVIQLITQLRVNQDWCLAKAKSKLSYAKCQHMNGDFMTHSSPNNLYYNFFGLYTTATFDLPSKNLFVLICFWHTRLILHNYGVGPCWSKVILSTKFGKIT